jgi:murein DD-endopeptidase MepM/ murein hydrolase activator NlpD
MNGAQGSAIVAAGGGTVILSGVKGGYGNTIMIDHGGGMVTLYAHQSSLAVSVGTSVSAGQVIGYVGSTGQSTAPHLHFEVRIHGAPVNPANYL